MKIAGIQFACSKNKEENTEKALRILDMAIESGAKMICFQELFNTSWFPKDRDSEAFSLAEKATGNTIKIFKKRAKDAGIVILVPFFEIAGKQYYNSCCVIDGNGKVNGIYRKVHVPEIPLWEESFYFSEGNRGFPVFLTEHGKIGVQTSWDNLYPEGSRILAQKGADIIFSPTACAFRSQQIWQTAISANAIANGVFILRVNRVGSEEAQDFYGMSFCVNPEGELIGGPTARGDSVLIADIDFEYLKQIRREWPIMKGRRTHQYGEILKEM